MKKMAKIPLDVVYFILSILEDIIVWLNTHIEDIYDHWNRINK